MADHFDGHIHSPPPVIFMTSLTTSTFFGFGERLHPARGQLQPLIIHIATMNSLSLAWATPAMMPSPMNRSPPKTKSPNSGVAVRAIDIRLIKGSPRHIQKHASGIFSIM
jgi:hypothetical protein